METYEVKRIKSYVLNRIKLYGLVYLDFEFRFTGKLSLVFEFRFANKLSLVFEFRFERQLCR